LFYWMGPQIQAGKAKHAPKEPRNRVSTEGPTQTTPPFHPSQELKERLESQRTDLERYYLEVNTKMRKEYEQRMEELKKSAEEEVDERLDASVKRILQQNRRMAEELKIHVQETDVLTHEVKILEAERQRLTREVALKNELEGGYAKRGAQQAGVIKEAQGKILALDASMQQLMEDFENERVGILRTTQSQVSDAQAEAEALRRLVKLKTRELKNVRRLAQEVLLQRSDVEAFLLSSLHTVRREVERGSLLPQSAGAEKGGGTAGMGGSPGMSGRMDIKELSWEDRERILRLLFSKINNQQQQAYYTNLPRHPLDQADELAG
jgi:F0F1-type ATP synthase membrane subunit b/b'